jgi:UDPglucose--hexose-1-phosphate uridylyltransferase
MSLEFRKIVVESKHYPPGSADRVASQTIEVRYDPLTGRGARINVERARRPKQASRDISLMERLAEESRASCPFCPERVETATPSFSGLAYRRLHEGDCWVFPNLYPFTRHHAVTVFTRRHFIPLSEVGWGELRDGLACSLRYLKDLARVDASARYWQISWNYMPPSGASILHPHFQVTAEDNPTTLLREELEASRRFTEENGACFWGELLKAEERAGERIVARGSRVAWLASYAPIGNREIIAIFAGKPSLDSLDSLDIEEFAQGLEAVARYYAATGVMSLNMSFYSAPRDSEWADSFYLHARIISRPTPTQLYVNDDGFMEKMNWEPVIDTLPEELAESLRPRFRADPR